MDICIREERLAGGTVQRYSSFGYWPVEDPFEGLLGPLSLVPSGSCGSFEDCYGLILDFWPLRGTDRVDVGILL